MFVEFFHASSILALLAFKDWRGFLCLYSRADGLDVLLAHVSVIMGLWSLSLWVWEVMLISLMENVIWGYGIIFSAAISLCLLGVKVGFDDRCVSMTMSHVL